jgi:hypothetical protein
MKDHTAVNVTESLTEIRSNWNLDPAHLFAVITDNGSNMLLAFQTVLG